MTTASRIDMILTKPQNLTKDAFIPDDVDSLSDHFPMIATFCTNINQGKLESVRVILFSNS